MTELSINLKIYYFFFFKRKFHPPQISLKHIRERKKKKKMVKSKGFEVRLARIYLQLQAPNFFSPGTGQAISKPCIKNGTNNQLLQDLIH